jgi:hypothetical protein
MGLRFALTRSSSDLSEWRTSRTLVHKNAFPNYLFSFDCKRVRNSLKRGDINTLVFTLMRTLFL